MKAKATPKQEEVVDDVEVTPLEAAENADEALEEELSKLSAAEAAKRQRERRKKNAQKARDQLKLQLNMTTPMDIGLEAHAPGEDLFNLKSVDGKKVSNAQTPLSDSEEDEGNAEFMIIPQQEQPEEDSDADLDDEELRIKRLESNLDEMYDAYQNAKLERDTKHRAREARRKKRQEEGGEWGGIGQNSDSDDDAEESEADSEVQPGRDSTPDSDSDSDSDVDSNDGRERQQGKGNKRLLTDLRDPAQTKKRKLDAKERAAALWYDQAVFKGVPGLDALLQDEQEEEEEEDEPSEVEEMESSDEQLPGHIKTKGLFEPQEVSAVPTVRSLKVIRMLIRSAYSRLWSGAQMRETRRTTTKWSQQKTTRTRRTRLWSEQNVRLHFKLTSLRPQAWSMLTLSTRMPHNRTGTQHGRSHYLGLSAGQPGEVQVRPHGRRLQPGLLQGHRRHARLVLGRRDATLSQERARDQGSGRGAQSQESSLGRQTDQEGQLFVEMQGAFVDADQDSLALF